MLTLILSIAAGIVCLIVTFKIFFSDFSDYLEGWRFMLTPDFISLFRGEYVDDRWAEIKMFFYHGFALLVGFAVYHYCK